MIDQRHGTMASDRAGGTAGGTVVRLGPAQAALRDAFLGWQCRLRQISVRQAGGRPGAGMRPLLRLDPAREPLTRITVLIVKREPEEITAQFRHMARRTQDPNERYDNAIKFLAAAYYQRPRDFSDELTALFGSGWAGLDGLLTHGRCVLEFAQYSQIYRLPCAVRALQEREPAHQATYWHNALFNPSLPPDARVLGFRPDWAHAEADPPPP